jgi:N-acetylneuraminate synthase
MSTPFDSESAEFLVAEMGVDVVKLPSGEITNAPFLLQVSRLGRPVILSTGMSTLGEVEMALGVLAYGYLGQTATPSEKLFRDCFSSDAGQAVLSSNVSLLHCTTEYPAPYEQVNLKVMDTLSVAFQLPVGLSDHTPGIAVAIGAVARGAKIIEKHFTLDRTLEGPDHRASLEPAELAAMVAGIRQVESAIGSTIKRPSASEWSNRDVARRSLVAAEDVLEGEPWTSANLTCKRPGTGLSPFLYWSKQETLAGRAYRVDEPLVE